MAGSDELIYRIKFEADEQSKQNVKRSLKELNEEQQKAGQSKLNEQLKESIKVGEKYNESNLSTIERLVELRKQIDGYRQSLAELRKAKRDGVELTDQQRAKEVEIRGALKDASQAYRDNQKDLIANKTAVQGNVVSYNQLSAETKLLEQQLRNMPIDKSSEEYKKMQAQIAQNKQAMKDFNAELGDHSMNVGNYAEALSTAASGLAIIQGPLGPLAGRLNSLNTTIQMSIPLIKAKVAAWGALRVAMLASGVGAIVVVLGTLIAALSKMQPVMDAVTKKWDQLAAVWGFAKDRIGALFGMNEKSNYSLWESVKVTGALADATVDLEEARIRSLPVIAQLEADISKLRKTAEDEALSHYERIEAMDEAIEKTKEYTAIEVEQAEERLRIAEQAADIARNERTDDEEIAKLRAELIQLSERQAMEERRLIRRKTSIINQMRTEEKQRRNNIEAIKNEADELRKAFNERVQQHINDPTLELAEQRHNQRVEMLKESNELERAVEEERRWRIKEAQKLEQERLDEAEENAGKRATILMKELMVDGVGPEEARAQAIKKVREQIAEEAVAIEKRKVKEIKAINEQAQFELTNILQEEMETRNSIRDQVEQLRKESAMRQAALSRQVSTRAHQDLLILEAQQEQRRLELQEEFREKFNNNERADRLAREQSELEFEQSLQETKTAIREEELQNRLALEQAYADLTFGVLNTIFGDSKEVQVATAIVDTYVAANKALASAPPPLSYVRAGAAVAMGLANVRKILSTEVGDKNVGGGGSSSQAGGLSSSRGFEYLNEPQDGPVARQVAESSASPQAEMNPTFIFEGDLDSEVMAIKVRKGNRTIDSKTLTTKSRA